MADRDPRRVPHWTSRPWRPVVLRPRLGEQSPGEEHVRQAQRRRREARHLPAEVRGEGADRRAERDARRGGRGEPAERLGPLRRGRRVGHVGLGDTGRAAAGALHQPHEEEQPEGIREREYAVSDGGRGEPDEQRRPAPIPVRDPPPEGRGHQLSDGEGGDQGADHLGRTLQLEGVERQQREHDHEADHVHEVHRDQYREAAETSCRRRHPGVPPRPCPPEPSANTAPLTSMSTTPYAAATPTSACRRLERISSEIGRVS